MNAALSPRPRHGQRLAAVLCAAAVFLAAALAPVCVHAQAGGRRNRNGSATDDQSNSTYAGTEDLIQRAQEGPIDISSTGETTYRTTPEGRVATGDGSVSIQTNDASIYCDHAEYNLDTHEALLIGNVRIYRVDTSIIADRAIYNFNTKGIRALNFSGNKEPFHFGGVSLFSPAAGAQYNIRNGYFTTDDSSDPDYHLRARRIRIYPDNRIIYIGSTLYVGSTPVFYFPYFYQSLDQQSGYQISPGYSSTYGAYLLTGITFPITEHLTGVGRVDYRSSRGIGLGFSFEYKPNRRAKNPPSAEGASPYASDDDPSVAALVSTPTTSPGNSTTSETTPGSAAAAANGNASTGDADANNGGNATARNPGYVQTGEALSRQIRNREGAQFLSYYVHDDKPDLNRTSLDRLPIDQDRYRFVLRATQFLTDDLYLKSDVDKISDRYLLQDFYEGEFTRNPNPDNNVSAVFYQPTFVATLLARAQLNDFFDSTERLPELSLEIPRLPLGRTGLFYTSENSAGYLRRSFDEQSPLPEYDTFRLDTYHELTYAKTLFGWLAVAPHAGARLTYYSSSAPSNTFASNLQNVEDDTSIQTLFTLNPLTASAQNLKQLGELKREIAAFQPEGDLVRPVVDAGVEASFKASRIYKDVESRWLGLDQIQHVVQPYVSFEEVEDFGIGSRKVLQFDRQLPTTQLLPINFPEYNTIDSIDESTVVRVGVRNRIQTKRDALTFDWLELDTFFQVNAYDPAYNSSVSNVFNQLTFRPVPWVNMTVDSQLPIFNGRKGFTEVDTSLAVQVTSNLDVTVSHLYLDNNPFFANSSLLRFNVYYRIDDNWAAAFSERYEFANHQLQAQSYTIYRDLTSFVASLAITVRNNNGINDTGIALNFTLKGVPKVSLPVGFDVNSVANQLTQ